MTIRFSPLFDDAGCLLHGTWRFELFVATTKTDLQNYTQGRPNEHSKAVRGEWKARKKQHHRDKSKNSKKQSKPMIGEKTKCIDTKRY